MISYYANFIYWTKRVKIKQTYGGERAFFICLKRSRSECMLKDMHHCYTLQINCLKLQFQIESDWRAE